MKHFFLSIGLLCCMLQTIIAQNQTTTLSYLDRATTKISQIGQIVTLDTIQQQKLINAYVTYSQSSDSITADQQNNKKEKERWLRKVNRHWQDTLMGTFSDYQRFNYLATITQPQVDSLVNADMNILKQCGLYSTDELQAVQNTLVDYHRQEQFILERDRYNIALKHENLIWLRTQRPKAYKMCEYIQELQRANVLKEGAISW
jgi:hypothetical protein